MPKGHHKTRLFEFICPRCRCRNVFSTRGSDVQNCTGCGQVLLVADKKPSKYGARKVTVDGQLFHSGGEAERWQELKLLERAGVISGLKRQVPFTITHNGVYVTTYIADYEYEENGAKVVEDFKGHATEVYRLKKLLMKAFYGIEIRETRKAR